MQIPLVPLSETELRGAFHPGTWAPELVNSDSIDFDLLYGTCRDFELTLRPVAYGTAQALAALAGLDTSRNFRRLVFFRRGFDFGGRP